MEAATLRIVLLLLALTAIAAAPSSASCASDSPDCLVENLASAVSVLDLLSRLSAATRRLTLRSISLTNWSASDAELSGTRARQLESLELDRVSLAGSLLQQQQLRGGSFPALRSLKIRGASGGATACPFAGGVVGFGNLQEVTVSDCRLGTALTQAWLRDLPQLRRLTVDNAKVDSLHLGGVDSATLSALTEIRLNGNNINTLADDAFGNMTNLRNLTLDGNVIQYIQSAAFTRLLSLQHLSIILPKEGQLAKIWEASLDGRFDRNTKLETLRIVNARLAEDQIPRTFDQLKQLRVLDLSGHRFRRLQNSVLSSLSSLEQLDLSSGSLICIHDRNFGVMSRLKRLSLAGNEIRVIGKRAFLGLASLQSLDLAANPVELIEPGAFCTLRPEIKEHPGLLSSWGMDPAKIEGSANVSEACPVDFNPNQLILSSKPQCPMPRGAQGAGQGGGNGSDGGTSRRSSEQSRHTFLIIIGLCVAFLLITVISMMAYKGWSKRKNAQLAKDEEKELELQAMVVAADGGASSQTQSSAPAVAGTAGGKKPQNGRQHRQHHHHHHQQQQPGKSVEPGVKKADSTEDAAAAAVDTEAPKVTKVETTVQVESPERCGATAPASSEPSPAAASEDASSTSSKPPMRPGITPMTTVPEDSDLEARAITTLVVI